MFAYNQKGDTDTFYSECIDSEPTLSPQVNVSKKTNREFTDDELSFPPDKSEIHVPDYISLTDKIHLKTRMLEFQANQEKAKLIARRYRDECSQLKTKLIEKDAEIVQAKLDATQTQDRLRHFWRNKIIEGQSRSGRILRNTMCIGTNYKL